MAVTAYCTDEDILIRAPRDFGLLRPDGAVLASGSDGVFESGERWDLTSEESDYEAQGVAGGNVVLLFDESDEDRFGTEGEPFAVEDVDGGTVTLRLPGQVAEFGQPPAPAVGLSGIKYECSTFAAQIEDASYELNQLFAVDERLYGRTYTDIYDPRVIRQLCVLLVLKRLCIDAWAKAEGDLWKAKADAYEIEFNAKLSGARLRFGADGRSQPPSQRTSVKISR